MSSKSGPAAGGGRGGRCAYKIEALIFEMEMVSDTLPRLQKSSFGENVLELVGEGWIFNPEPPFDNSILRGPKVLSSQEYTDAIKQINLAHAQNLVGLSRFYPPSEIPQRRQLGMDAVRSKIDELNKKTAGRYHFDLSLIHI